MMGSFYSRLHPENSYILVHIVSEIKCAYDFQISRLVQSGSQKWHIPITYITSIDPKRTQYFLLTSENATMDIQGDWFKLNFEASGYYVVNYDVKNWKRIAKQLVDDHRAFTILDRSSIIKDVFTMAEEGLLPFPVALDVTKYLDKVFYLLLIFTQSECECYLL